MPPPDPADAKLAPFHQAIQERQFQKAKGIVQRILRQHPASLSALVNMARVLRELGEFRESVYFAEKAHQQLPHDTGLLFEYALSLARAADPRAEAAARRYIQAEPTQWHGHLLLCKMLHDQERWADLDRESRHAVACGVRDDGLYCGMANALASICRSDEAAAVMGEAQLHFPSNYTLSQIACFTRNYVHPIDNARTFAVHRNSGRLLAQTFHDPPARPETTRDPDKKLRVAFISSDLREHSVTRFIEPIMLGLDRARFHVTGVHNNLREDHVTRRLRDGTDDWVQLGTGLYQDQAQKLRDRGIDIAVELNGLTGGNVLQLLHLRVAPIQITYLGYPNTTGLDALDYRIVDSITDPAGNPYDAQDYCVEKLLRLDPCFLCFAPRQEPDQPMPGHRPLDDSRPITLGSFNATFKINTYLLGLWKQMLDRLPDARLVFRAASMRREDTVAAVRRTFADAGLDQRVEIRAARPDVNSHLNDYRDIDIALDSYPYHGTTTTCEALWMGVPVVSLVGNAHAARVGLSLLTNAGVPELATHFADDYVDAVVKLATDRPRLAAYHATLRPRLLASPLCDQRAMVTRFESMLRTIWRRHCVSGSAIR